MLKHTIIALAALGAGLSGLSATQASAFPIQPAPGIEQGSASLLTDVRSKYDRNRVYNRRYDGMRCGSWNNRCRYHHGGYYYENPWWLFPVVGAGVALGAAGAYVADGGYHGGYGSRHVQWCLDRYRSYNPRTNTWVSYSGRVNQCVSPY